MISATSPNQEGVEGTDSRSGLDDHRRISDTGHIYLLVGNTCVLPHQGGIFLSSFATAYISLRNSWVLQLPLLCQPSQPAPLAAGSQPSRSIPGATILGNIFRSLRSFSRVPAPCCSCMNRPPPCSSKVSG